MNDHPLLQTIGTAFIALLAGVCYHIAAAVRPRHVYQRALYLIALYLMITVGVRILALVEWLSQSEARVVNGFTAGFYAATLIAMLWMERYERRSHP